MFFIDRVATASLFGVVSRKKCDFRKIGLSDVLRQFFFVGAIFLYGNRSRLRI